MLSNQPPFSDPHPLYKEMRQHYPISQDENGTWHLTRYDDVKMLMSDPRFMRQPPDHSGYINQEKSSTILDDVMGRWSFFNDPPDHTRLREVLGIMINPSFIKNTREIIDSMAESLLTSLLSHSTIDFMQAFAYPLPVNVINTLLGTSLDNTTLRKWSLAILNAADCGSPEELASINDIVLEMQHYFANLILVREQQPSNDWISTLVNVKNTYHLSFDDIVANCIFLLIVGHETTHLALGMGLMALLQNPQQRQLLQNDLKLVPSAIEEILRFEAPLNKVSRWTSEPILISDVMIPKDQLVVGIVNAANRDPEKFIRPDEFDITRTNNRHLTFGCGIHNCIGALLARLELHIAFKKLAPHLHKFHLIEDQIEWVSNSSFRYLFKLMINIKNT
ncbi:MAG: cytochrome P450 [Gammaproteobacteria bacterium]|nr:cytochrome P450 [Gammaproteobacteria bacterium]MCW5582741.1 cytochrome P450 [Gammaproteobacteria bacterium]